MSRKQLCLAILLSLIAMSTFSRAQDEQNQVAALIGRTFVSDQGLQCGGCPNPFIHTGKGLTLEGNFSRYLLYRQLFAVSGEVPVVWAFQQKLNAGENVVPESYKDLFITPAARVNLFPGTAISPWVSIGGGYGHISQSSSLVFGGSNPGKSSNMGVLEGGFGLDVRVWRKYSVRGQVRDFWGNTPNYPLATTDKTRQHNYFVGVGVIYHF